MRHIMLWQTVRFVAACSQDSVAMPCLMTTLPDVSSTESIAMEVILNMFRVLLP